MNNAALTIRNAYQQGQPCEPVREQLPEMDLATAYAVQKHNSDYWQAQGRRVVGCKIGLTSKSVQKQLGVDQPDFGLLYADMAIADGEKIAMDMVLQPKVEAEVALVLGRDINMANPTMVDVISAVDYALPAIEIVGSRIKNWDINIVDTIADNASSGLFVLGNEPKKLDQLDLRLCGMVMERRGEQVSVGAGLACLGHPLNAALWLAKTMVANGSPLKAGDILLTGALGPMVAVQAGDIFEAKISGLGSVRAAFAQE
ncbi:2-keto-4-pentenoate hydratase [Dasania sp. GY-MA-18]|uniref:2-keto-4-pentenoate hydratase n=1 Tax=Dasania phycosphaerae TaxID=2950436 RepID=A0A9J6RM18_9GAMM|nr:2-keto-4-pentenoate hydratase [Dasania sp. GY-MA-18]MCZ0865240.1 2-keto-4-pentenoate hydratase [Dasania phycosphaerae]MCZ0868966.1 2-keto-4-pentenoate hydratase [Dasania phycosphaerae]